MGFPYFKNRIYVVNKYNDSWNLYSSNKIQMYNNLGAQTGYTSSPLKNEFRVCGLVQTTLCPFISSRKIEANVILGLYIGMSLNRRISHPDYLHPAKDLRVTVSRIMENIPSITYCSFST